MILTSQSCGLSTLHPTPTPPHQHFGTEIPHWGSTGKLGLRGGGGLGHVERWEEAS